MRADDPAGAERRDGDLSAPLHVLLAEDNPVNQRITEMLLGRLGHRVDIVSDGVGAVDAVARTSYDAVLMDVQMPRLDGLEATRTIRASRSQHQPPIVALTGGDLADDRAACSAAGMDAFLTKPLTLASLADVLADVTADGGGTPVADVDAQQSARQVPADQLTTSHVTSREALIGRRLDELAGPDPLDEDLDLFSRILRSFVDRSPSLVDDLADAMRHGPVATVEHQAHRLRGSAANLGGADLAGLLERIENRCRLGQPSSPDDIEPVRAELAELRRSLATVASTLESRTGTVPAARPHGEGLTDGAPR